MDYVGVGEVVFAKHQIYTSSEPADQTKAIDTLAAYGEQAINALTEVINLSDISDKVREYGRKTIEGIKGQN